MADLTAERLPELPPYRAPRLGEPHRPWSMYLTTENAEHVAAWIRETLSGEQLVVVTAYEYAGWRPEVEAPASIDEGPHGAYGPGGVKVSRRDRSAMVLFAAGRMVYGFNTSLAAQPRYFAGCMSRPPRGRPRDVSEWIDLLPVLAFTPRMSWEHRRGLQITNLTPEGLSHWVTFLPVQS